MSFHPSAVIRHPFLEHFETLAEAPDAIPRLRQFILDLAVRGKLVEQDPDDEPASELLKRIAALKPAPTQKRDPLPLPEPKEAPFPLPEGWQWVRVQHITTYVQRGKSPRYSNEKKIPVIAQKCIQWHGFELFKAQFIDPETLSAYSEDRFVADGDLLWNSTGLGTLGRIIVFKDHFRADYPQIVADSHVTVIRPATLVDSDYLHCWFAGPVVQSQIEAKSTGTTKQTELATGTVSSYEVPLPPLAEQHRIVAKVDELMALCDRLEAAQAERETRRTRLVAATHARLSDSALRTPHSAFFISALPRLTSRPADIPQLRQTILNLAVRGSLVPQDPSHEPASELLKRLAAETNHYAAQNRTPATKLEPVPDDATPFSPPSGWAWARLASLFKVVTDGDHVPPPKSENGVAFLTIGNVTTGRLDFSNCRFVPQDYFDAIAPYRRPAKGDILYTVVGATYGRPALVDIGRPFCVQRHIAILKPTAEVDVNYLRMLLGSPLMYKQATSSLTGTAQPTIPLRPLRNFLVPLPPLLEQHRIVAKVDELMALCDRLEAQLITTQTQSRRLLEATFHQALATS